MKTMLKAPGTQRLKLSFDEPPSNFAFKFNLRRYSEDCLAVPNYPLSSLKARRCRLTL